MPVTDVRMAPASNACVRRRVGRSKRRSGARGSETRGEERRRRRRNRAAAAAAFAARNAIGSKRTPTANRRVDELHPIAQLVAGAVVRRHQLLDNHPRAARDAELSGCLAELPVDPVPDPVEEIVNGPCL
eukprot:3068535-Rhodomonas_salina.3